MSHLVDLAKLAQIDRLIRRRATGSHDDLAEMLDISSSTLFKHIAYLKEELDASVIYDNDMLSYKYSRTPKFHLGFE